MLVVSKRRYIKRYIVGGAGVFDTISGFFKRLLTSNAAKQVASNALSAGKDVAREIGKKALDVGKTAAIDAGKRLVDKAALLLTPKPEISQKSKHMLASLIDDGDNINNLLSGGSVIKIQDLVRRLNGAGMKIA